MKKNKYLPIWILLGGLAIVLVFYFSLTHEEQKHYQWVESYQAESDQPYGMLFIQKLLASFRPGQQFIVNKKTPLHQLLDSLQPKTKTDYVIMGNSIYFNAEDRKALLNFIHEGNDAFIASNMLPVEIIDTMFVSECGQTVSIDLRDTLQVNMNFYNQDLSTSQGYTYSFRMNKRDRAYSWASLYPFVFCDSTKGITPMGYIDPDKVNFFKLSFGKGNLYVHTNPVVFTNYFMTKPNKAEYASSALSHLNSHTMIWDEYTKTIYTSKDTRPSVNPMAYILQQESLAMAWRLMLLAAILYALFAAKRKQRIIPVLEPKTNTSLEFVRMIGALHFQNGNNRDIARKKTKYFFHFIKAKYGIQVQHLTGIAQNRIVTKSKVDPETLKAVADQFEWLEKQVYCTDTMLVDLQNALEKFYQQCK